MPSNWAFLVIYGMIFVFAIYIGFLIGQMVCRRFAVTTREYWTYNIAGVCLAVLVSMFTSAPLVHTAVIGLLAGYIVGFKMSFGESTGPWKAVDKFFNVNRGHRKVAEQGTGEERRRRRKDGGKEGPALMSVDDSKKGKTR